MIRVFSKRLNPEKKWFALNNYVCGLTPKKYCKSDIFEQFPDEIAACPIAELRGENGADISIELRRKGFKIQSTDLLVGTVFAILAGNLRKRNLNDSKFLNSREFTSLKEKINKLEINQDGNDGSTIVSTESPSLHEIKYTSSPKSEKSVSSFSSDSVDEQEGGFSRCGKRKSPPKFDDEVESSSSSLESIEMSCYNPKYKIRKLRGKCNNIVSEIHQICEEHHEKLANVIARCCLFERGDLPEQCKQLIQDVFCLVEKELGLENTFAELVPRELWQKKVDGMAVPDWQQLLLKLEIPISDEGWQKVLNRSHLGKGGVSSVAPILLSKNNLKALKKMVFEKVENIFNISSIGNVMTPGYEVALESIICWQIRELRLHGLATKDIQLNLKLDGRPLCGRNQVLIGVIPSSTSKWSNHSCKSFYPLAIANCKESRENLQTLIGNLNKEKEIIKRDGIEVDGIKYNITFKVTLDLKALYLLLVKIDDESFELGGKGLEVEFCLFCHAIRGCNCDLGSNSICLEHFMSSKANIGSFRGIRDDLTFLLEEDISSVNLCALHCELRNTEQLIGSLGLCAYRIGTLKECNKILGQFGPETTGDRVNVQLRQGQQTAVTKQNIKVKSFSGNTERLILENIEDIVRHSLPHEALKKQFEDPNLARVAILNKITFCSEQVKYYNGIIKGGVIIRDFGSCQEQIPLLQETDVLDKLRNLQKTWEEKLTELKTKLSEFRVHLDLPHRLKKKKDRKSQQQPLDALSEYAAEITYEFYVKVYTGWRDLAKVMRNEIYGKDEQWKIDLYDIMCKEWGLLLRELFGSLLGTGDYGHMTVEHTPMLLRVFGSLREYSNQSIESAHSLQRQLYSKATSHDRHGYTSSIKQIITHFYAEKMLFFRLSIRKAVDCCSKDKPFHFSGCGWSLETAKKISWTEADRNWIMEMDSLLTNIFGEDKLHYKSDKITNTAEVAPESFPDFEYVHREWENQIPNNVCSPTESCQQANQPDVLSKLPIKEKKVIKEQVKNEETTMSKQKNPPTTISRRAFITPKSTTTVLFPDLKKCHQRNLTRRQLASLQLPPEVFLSYSDLEIVHDSPRYSNPLLIGVRPTEDILRKSKDMLSTSLQNKIIIDIGDSDDGSDDAVHMLGLGTFNRHALNIWEAACRAAKVSALVNEEIHWLNSISPTEKSRKMIEKVFWDSRPSESMMTIGDTTVDVQDLTTLVGERHLTGFIIDAACTKLKEISPGGLHTIYLPSAFQEWAKASDIAFLKERVSPYFSAHVNSTWILTPQHVKPNHWGLLALNLRTSQMYYDDGLCFDPPDGMIMSVKRLVSCLHELGHLDDNSKKKWELGAQITRFGMPPQPSNSGSCGMGVILSFQSFVSTTIDNALPSFKWSFSEMQNHRIHLLEMFMTWKL